MTGTIFGVELLRVRHSKRFKNGRDVADLRVRVSTGAQEVIGARTMFAGCVMNLHALPRSTRLIVRSVTVGEGGFVAASLFNTELTLRVGDSATFDSQTGEVRMGGEALRESFIRAAQACGVMVLG